MKYIITENSINVCIDGRSFICDSAYEYFDDIKKALESGTPKSKIIHLFRKQDIAAAKTLLKK